MLSVLRESKLLARHTTAYAIGTFLQRIGALVLLPLYTSYLTPTDYGVKELVALTIDVVGILLATAISHAIFRFYFEYDEPRRRNAVMSTSVLALGTGGLVLLGAAWPLSPLAARTILDDPALAHYFMIALGTLWFQTVNKVAFAWLRAHQKSLEFVGLSLARFLVNIGLNIWFIVGLGWGVFGILLATLLTTALLFLCLTVPLFLRIGLRFDRGILAKMWSFGWPSIFGQLGGTIVHISDRFFLKGFVGIADAGIYSLGYRFGTLPGQFVSEPFNQTWLPRRFEIAREEGSERVFGRIFTYYLTLIGFVGLAVAVLSRDVLHVMADEGFWRAAQVIPVIVLANIVFTFHYHFNIGLLLEKKTKHLAVLNVGNAGLVLLLNWLLIPRLGPMGAALATLIAFAVKSTATFALGRRYYRTHFEGRRAAKLLVVAATVFLVTWWVQLAPPLLSLAVRGGVLVALYPALLLALGFFTPEERAKAREVLRRRLGRGRGRN